MKELSIEEKAKASWIDWLEKQGKISTKSVHIADIPFGAKDSELFEETITIPDGCFAYIDDNKVIIKRRDKSKFNVGDWIISNNKKSIYQVIEVKRGIYVLRDNTDNHDYHIGIEECEKSGRLWNISDAMDGDVLACGDKVTDCPFIFHNLTKELNPRSYCGVNTLGHFQDNDENGGFWCNSYEVRPATKEQRDILFAKMKDSGYVWDAKKKELKHDGSE